MDEDLEFRDMVLKKLEESGSLLSIKAKLRALLYHIIENERNTAGDQQSNESDITSSSTFEKGTETQLDNKALALELVLDMLTSLNLQYTKQVLCAEAGYTHASAATRESLSRQLGLKPISDAAATAENSQDQPLLVTLVERLRGEVAENSSEIESITNDQPSIERDCTSTGTKTENADTVSTQDEETNS
ncbi:hypothetical protein AND_004209 [Anopheles darlingi]|uniref:LisH domain-containing protein n=1 Tax=Anopheles darlingi TaxID=43151 RepID=W5JIV7_ANODA|nr:uncharacterized protein LOC125949775 [Anopheles darlingi]ETN64061.1 hypothetical protein AND_004209 [Anopheles darlingi]